MNTAGLQESTITTADTIQQRWSEIYNINPFKLNTTPWNTCKNILASLIPDGVFSSSLILTKLKAAKKKKERREKDTGKKTKTAHSNTV